MRSEKELTFSICIPNYNYGSYIGETIESVLQQSYPHFELIINDNASTDKSMEVIASFKDKRIRCYQNKYNIGFAPNLQKTTMYARNQYINVLSSDDQMKPLALEKYSKAIMQHEANARRLVLFSDQEVFDDDNNTMCYVRKVKYGFEREYIPRMTMHINEEVRGRGIEIYSGKAVLQACLPNLVTFAPFLCTVYSRELWDTVEGYNSIRTIGPDKHFGYKLLEQDPLVVYIPEVLFRYRDTQSANRAAQISTLKQPIDDYLYTIEYNANRLASLNLGEYVVQDALVRKVCHRTALSLLGRGNYLQAWRLFCFSLASYPMRAVKSKYFIPLLILLGLGPIGKILAYISYRAIYTKRNNSKTYE